MSADTTRRYAGRRAVPARSLSGRFACRVVSAPREQGQIGVLALGLFVLAAILVLGAVDVTAAQLARMRLLDAADAAALDAADALDERSAYESGMLERLILTDGSVPETARTHLARAPRTPGLT